MRIAVLSIALLALLSLVPPLLSSSILPREVHWRVYHDVTDVVVYDYDMDGELEYLLLPGRVLENYVVLKSPYPSAYPRGLVMDIDWDGEEELVLYDPSSGRYAVYKGTTLILNLTLPRGEPVVSLSGRSIAVGNVVAWMNSTLVVPDAAKVVPVTDELGRAWALYNTSEALILYGPGGRRYTVYNDSLEPLGAWMRGGVLYVLARARDGSTVYIRYYLGSGAVRISAYSIRVDRVVGFRWVDGAFIAVRGGKVYRFTPSYAVLECVGYPVGARGTILYIAYWGRLRVYDYGLRRTVDVLKLPQSGTPSAVKGVYPTLAVLYGGRAYIPLLVEPPSLLISVKPEALVGEEVPYSVVTTGRNVTVMVNGTTVPSSGSIVFNRTGIYVFTAVATNGLITVTKNATVKVVPRPLTISIRVVGTPTAFGSASVVVETHDGVNGSRVEVPCRILAGGREVETLSWRPVEVVFTPRSFRTAEVELTAVCGDGEVYRLTRYTLSVPLAPAAPSVHVDYLGGGRLRISLLLNGTLVPGRVAVTIDGRSVGERPNPAVVRVAPGNHTLVVRFMPSVPVAKDSEYVLQVSYFYNVSEVPKELLGRVLVADRVINRTRVVTVVKNVTVEKPVYVPRYVEKPVVDTRLLALFAGIGAGAGLGAGLLLGRRMRGSVEEIEIRREKSGGEEGVDMEYPES